MAKRSARFLLAFEKQCMKCRLTLRSLTTTATNIGENSTKSFEDIPAPPGIYKWPYVGLPLHFEPFGQFNRNRFDKVIKSYKNQLGDVFKLRIANIWMIYLCDPGDIEIVMRSEGKYPIRPVVPLHEAYCKKKTGAPFLSCTHGEEWHKLRRLVHVPMMKPRNVAKYIPKLSEVADDFVTKYSDKHVMEDLPNCCYEYSTEGAGTLCFDARLGCIGMSQNKKNVQLLKNVNDFFEMTGESLRRVPLYKWIETPFFKRFVQVYDSIQKTSDEFLKEAYRRLEAKQGQISPEDANLMMDMLSVPNTTPEVVNRNAVDLFVGAIESTAVSMSFFLYHLAKNPDVQQRLYEEVEKHVQPKGLISVDVMEKLPYMKACLRESFRCKFPISTGTMRVLTNDIVIKGYKIPAGVPFSFAFSVIGKDEKYFPEPDKFKPERWLRTEDRHLIHHFSQLPFGFGVRNCLGQRFAEIELYVIVAKMVRNYRLSLPPGVTEVPHIYKLFVTSKQPFSLVLEKRR